MENVDHVTDYGPRSSNLKNACPSKVNVRSSQPQLVIFGLLRILIFFVYPFQRVYGFVDKFSVIPINFKTFIPGMDNKRAISLTNLK